MRTTLDIEDDVLQAARELAVKERTTAGRVLSALARLGLQSQGQRGKGKHRVRRGVPLLPSRGEVVTLQKVRALIDSEGV